MTQSFKENIASILFVSQSFRNVVVEVYFDLPKDYKIKESDKGRLLDLYRETFKEHSNVLYMFGEDERSLIIYIPVVDSFNEIKEKLNLAVTESSLMVRDERGIQNVLAKYAIVAYPYSNEEMILGDLKYAVSQGKPFNLYLPTRYKNNIDAKLLMNTSMNLNYSSKIIGALSELDYSAKNNERNHVLLREVFDAITNFMDIDDGGIIVYNSLADQYQTYATNSRGFMFNGAIDKSFVEKLGAAVDDDDVYYFSTIRHAGIALQQPLSMYGIQSGIYYVIKDLDSIYNINSIIKDLFNPYTINDKDIKLLIERVGTNLNMLSCEIDKIKAYKDKDLNVTSDDINKLTHQNIEADMFLLVDTIINNDKEKSIQIYKELINNNEEPIAIIITLANKIRNIYITKELLRKGYSEVDIAGILGVKPGYLYYLRNSINKYDSYTLYSLLSKLADLDYNIKTNKIDKYTALELFILEK